MQAGSTIKTADIITENVFVFSRRAGAPSPTIQAAAAIIDNAVAMIDDTARWTQHASARAVDGVSCDPLSSLASTWAGDGALIKAARGGGDAWQIGDAFPPDATSPEAVAQYAIRGAILRSPTHFPPETRLSEINDGPPPHRGHLAVIAIMRSAAAALRKLEEEE